MPEHDIASIAALDEPVRRRIYDLLRRAGKPMSREEVAAEAGIARKLAAFHLDKMLDLGLLKTHYARPGGRSGPGAGRTAKYYEPSNDPVSVSIPPRRYNLAGELLLEALRAQGPSALKGAQRVAREHGETLGEGIKHERGLRRPSAARTMAIASEVLGAHGFEPSDAERGVVALRNCPFHDLAKQAPELMCEMNRAYIEGLLRGLGNDGVQAVLECQPGDCCVTLRTSTGH